MGIQIRALVNYAVLTLLGAGLLAGCSGIKPYPNTFEKNIEIRTKTDSRFLAKVRAAVDIYSVDTDCQTMYQGTIDLDKAAVAIGIPADRPSYLVFAFASSAFLSNSKSTISYDTLLTPRSGHNYTIDVSYIDDIYNVEIREKRPRKRARRRIPQKELSSCRSRIANK